MSERIIGTVYILSLNGEAERNVDVPIGTRSIIEGEFGALMINADLAPPQIQAKGNIFLYINNQQKRSARINPKEKIQIVLFTGAFAGSIVYEHD